MKLLLHQKMFIDMVLTKCVHETNGTDREEWTAWNNDQHCPQEPGTRVTVFGCPADCHIYNNIVNFFIVFNVFINIFFIFTLPLHHWGVSLLAWWADCQASTSPLVPRSLFHKTLSNQTRSQPPSSSEVEQTSPIVFLTQSGAGRGHFCGLSMSPPAPPLELILSPSSCEDLSANVKRRHFRNTNPPKMNPYTTFTMLVIKSSQM